MRFCLQLRKNKSKSLSELTRKFHGMVLIIGLICSGSGWRAPGQTGEPVERTILPVASAMPANLPDGKIVGVGGQQAFIVEESATNPSAYLVHNNRSTRLFAVGDPAPGHSAADIDSWLTTPVNSPR
jgi:hypothetical protein